MTYVLRMTGVEFDGEQDHENDFYLVADTQPTTPGTFASSWVALHRYDVLAEARAFQTIEGARAAFENRGANLEETVVLVQINALG